MKITALMLGSALVAGTLAWTPAQAMPFGSGAPTLAKEVSPNIQTVDDDYWGYGGAFLGGVLLGSAIDRDYDDDDYPRYRYDYDDDYDDADAHVSYCLQRYRSYHVRSDTFMGYDGYRHHCDSPY